MRDRFQREITYLRMSVTDLCNLRCRYCMPAKGVCKRRHEEMLTEDEMVRAAETAASLGIRKIRITGGEPLVKKNLLSICARTAAVPGIRELCLTTNGTLLPDRAQALHSAGVSRVNISLDTLVPEKYAYITRGGSLQEALDGIEAALAAGFRKVKINTVLIGGFNDDEIRPLAQLTCRWPVDVRFIELMPMPGQQLFSAKSFVPGSIVRERLPELLPAGGSAAGRQAEHCPAGEGVAGLWRLPDAQGNVGLISPVFDSFCGRCNRIRLTADGRLKPCLHAAAEFPIKGLSDAEVKAQFIRAIRAKPESHAGLSAEKQSRSARSMNGIGG